MFLIFTDRNKTRDTGVLIDKGEDTMARNLLILKLFLVILVLGAFCDRQPVEAVSPLMVQKSGNRETAAPI